MLSRINCTILEHNVSNQMSGYEEILFVMMTKRSVRSWKLRPSTSTKHPHHNHNSYDATISKTTTDSEEVRITVSSSFFHRIDYKLTIR